jgi:CBS domain-containing protein
MQIKDVMKRKFEAVAPDTPLWAAAGKMRTRGISLLAVCEGEMIIGLLTSHDIAVRATAQGCDPRQAQVRDVMMTPAICGREDQSVTEVAGMMRRWQLCQLPVLNQHHRLVGIVSWEDLRRNARSRSRRRSSGSAAKGGRQTGRKQSPIV